MVGREGLEPPKAKPPDLQSGPFDHFGTDPRKTVYLLEGKSHRKISNLSTLFVAQGFNRMEFRCTSRGINSKDKTCSDRHHHSEKNRTDR